ncbi:hypothetical protein KY290_006336 [Solanum tuberosum]|uniref:Endonuclease/exonuclease/phosphatase n=1 Tax=Solanum tuberosum TaxID=4113 RepID=A0ABQ7WIL6_SOLTU|nr:hypothetical protein KY284_006376 [Solanum tuberosum]KAH0723665.1 hypothetical protein KY289_006709 [Solanum tuberosum]KAH0751302.1 hypothetical protein KY285_004450 [Solanum tuberosum]KAH0779909.1 hypothetical protein KY290_006336 [Solanum tuberosum]
MEPFQSPAELDQYKRKLDWDANIILDTMQQITIKFKIRDNFFLITAVYARCTALERLELWEELEDLAGREHCPWVVGGDFNVILSEEEKLGGLQLDRILVNQEFMDIFPSSEVHHLIRHRSDHAPLHMTCNSVEGHTLKPFRFLNFWSKHKYFKKIAEDNWCVDFVGNPFVEFQAKLKKIKKALSAWSRTVYGDIFQQIATIEDVIKVKEAQMEIHPSESNREGLRKVEAELKKFLKMEEEFWKQKAGMK